ncbi:type VI secretion system Vgr family protein [Ideonella sp. BN130291]|uniref:type VI secretion system Vgr family protein n=1 Tax=Ideonella sp. BN130291 TaxID=3112940 RepID=UPI002E26F2A7|nr:type VI secretion system Vgr family protein [Ideonella sp. BN130291]
MMDLVQQILDALGLAGPGQHERLLRLHTPLGPDVLLAERAEVVEGIGPGSADHAGFSVRVTALSTDPALDFDELIGQPMLLELLTADSRTDLRPWHGHVTRFSQLGSDGGLTRYELTVEPWLAFLRWRTDSFVFQNMTVMQIVEAVFARHAGQGRLLPQWRWELADASVYAERSLCLQYRETDLEFVQRLLAEEGLFCWFEHEGDASADGLGQHTLVIADHNGCFTPAREPRVRYTQSGAASFSEDGLQRWQVARRVRTHAVDLSSADYRGLGLRPVSAAAVAVGDVGLTAVDVPGQYSYEDSARGERLAAMWLQALQAPAQQWQGNGSVRAIAPGTTFEVLDHPQAQPGPHVALTLTHRARNNLSGDVQAQLQRWLGDLPHWGRVHADSRGRRANASDEPLYRVELRAQPAAVPVRAPASARGLAARPKVHGTQTAIVVGLDAPVHADRDHRVKIQFHWQRGSASSHGLDHDQGCNAPASDASGTWVRVSEALAGANWGSHFVPRLGQEVLVGFAHGDIDRPVVVGAVYNGVGQAQANGGVDAQGNQVAAGNATATGDAPAWFPGSQAQGALQGHQHTAVFTGIKSQELAASANGSGGYNQWVLDDTPGANRIELSSTSAATRLQLGHLLMQKDNQRLQPRGHGFDAVSAGYGAVRAGSGLLVSAHGRQASTTSSQQMDSREVQASLQTAQELMLTLADSAHQHQAQLGAEPASKEMLTAKAKGALLTSLQATEGGEGASDADETTVGGGQGTTAAFGRPDVAMAAPGGIGTFTPASTIASAGATVSLTAGQDMTLTAQRHHSTIAKDGIVWFTYGKAQNANKPNAETGIKLHAGTGSVSVQAASAKSLWAADKKIDVASTTDAVTVGSPQKVLLNGGGSAMTITNGSITLTTSGSATFKAAMKELTGAGSASSNSALPLPGEFKPCQFRVAAAAQAHGSAVPV